MTDDPSTPVASSSQGGTGRRTAERPRSVKLIAIAVGVVMVGLIALLVTRDPAGDRASESPLIGERAPAVAGDALIGEPYDIGTIDRWLLVNFFATWCVPCIEEHPELRKLDADGEEAGDLDVISIAYDDKEEKVRDFFLERGGDWTVLDSDAGQTALDWAVARVPESFLVSPTGIVVERFQGGVRAADVQALIAAYEEAAASGTGS